MRNVLAVFISAILALSLTACGTVTVTTAQPEPQPAAEVETPTPEPTEEPKEEVVEEPSTEEPATEEVATEESANEEPEAPTIEMTPMDALLNSNMGEYISDGVFDDVKFGNDTGASEVRIGKLSSTFIYGDWFIQTGNSGDSHPNTSYTVVGLIVDGHINCKYSYLFSREDAIYIAGVDESSGIYVPVECIIHLKDIFDSVSKNGLNVAPDAVGTDFRPCDPMDETIQY